MIDVVLRRMIRNKIRFLGHILDNIWGRGRPRIWFNGQTMDRIVTQGGERWSIYRTKKDGDVSSWMLKTPLEFIKHYRVTSLIQKIYHHFCIKRPLMDVIKFTSRYMYILKCEAQIVELMLIPFQNILECILYHCAWM